MGILSSLGIIKEPLTTVTNIKTGTIYKYDHSKYDILVEGGKATISFKKGKNKGRSETMDVLTAVRNGYLSGTFVL